MCDVGSGIHQMVIFTRLSGSVIHTASDDNCSGGLSTRLVTGAMARWSYTYFR